MRTTKPISTISFNSPEYLALKLHELEQARKISFWAFIIHQPEDDEGGGKEHCHVYIEPSRMVQTDDLRSELREFDPSNPDKPFGCLPFRQSKFGPWFLYAIHDKRYLLSLGQSRKYSYHFDEILTSDYDNLVFLSKTIDMLELSRYSDMLEAIENGVTFPEYFRRGNVPIPQVRNFEIAWNMLLASGTYRNMGDTHEN